MSKDALMKREGIGQGLALVASGIFVLTASHQGRESAMLASFVQQCAFDPPLIVTAVQSTRPVRRLIDESRMFALSILGKKSTKALKHFWNGVPNESDPFAGQAVVRFETAIPILKEAIGFLECRLRTTAEAGDHMLYIGEVINGGRIANGEPFVRIRTDGFDY